VTYAFNDEQNNTKKDKLEIAALKQKVQFLETQNHALQNQVKGLKKAYSDLEHFSSMASHDLKSPLRTITSYAQLLERKLGNHIDEDVQDFLQFITNGSKQMHTIIKDIMNYSKTQQSSAKFELTDLNVLLEDVTRALGKEIQESNAKINGKQLPKLSIIRSGMFQLFLNLIGNAIKFRSEQAPKIQITANKQGCFWHFKVSDNGLGMENEYQEKAFEVFQRINHLDRPGSGIGLAICKKIVTLHQGTISYYSELGKGTTFFFSIKAF